VLENRGAVVADVQDNVDAALPSSFASRFMQSRERPYFYDDTVRRQASIWPTPDAEPRGHGRAR
jgi:hypothetical protein